MAKIIFNSVKVNPKNIRASARKEKNNSGISEIHFGQKHGNFSISLYSGVQMESMRSLGLKPINKDTILIVPNALLPKQDIVYLIGKSGILNDFNSFCDALAFCTSISALDTSNKEKELDAFTVLNGNDTFTKALGQNITSKTIFINLFDGCIRISPYKTIIDIAHELVHLKVSKTMPKGLPADIEHLFCTIEEKRAALNIYKYFNSGDGVHDTHTTLSKLTGTTTPKSTMMENLVRLNRKLVVDYIALVGQGRLKMPGDQKELRDASPFDDFFEITPDLIVKD